MAASSVRDRALVVRPDECAEPGDLVGIAHVHGIEVDAGTPDDLRKLGRRGEVIRYGALDHHRARAVSGVDGVVIAELEGVAIGVQAETGGRSHLEQRDRLTDLREQRQDRGEPRGVVGLHRPTDGGLQHELAVLDDPVAEGLELVERGAEVPGEREDERDLPLHRRQLVDDLEQLGVVGRAPGELGVHRREVERVDIGEHPIPLRRERFVARRGLLCGCLIDHHGDIEARGTPLTGRGILDSPPRRWKSAGPGVGRAF